MTAEGKIGANEIGRRPLGSVRILLTDDPLGGPATPGYQGTWRPAKNKRGMVAATVTNIEYVSGSRRHKVYLTTDRGPVGGVAPHQTFWLAPADTPEPTEAPADRPEHTTPKLLEATRGVRVLITERYSDAAGGGAGEWCAAKKVKPRHGELSVPGEPPYVHAATVLEVRPSATARRFDVVTNLGTVEGVTAGQRFRLAPDGMRDSADIRADIRADMERTTAALELDRTNPRDVDGNRVAPGELVELLDYDDNRPHRVTRAIRAYGVIGGLLVARPYERAYGDNPAGTGLALTFRRLADQGDGPTAVRSCGCPAPVRDAIVPPPVDGGRDAWGFALADRDRETVEDNTHRTECRWYVELEPARPYVPPPVVVPAVLDADAVRIERHGGSVTQREVSVSYRGELLGRFRDDPELCPESNGHDPHKHDDGADCYGGYHGASDQHWHDVAAYQVGKRTPAEPAAPFRSRWATLATTSTSK